MERVEQRKDAQLCRTWDIALPVELTQEQHVELTSTYCKNELVSRGMIVDVSIHCPHKSKDSSNHHIHIAATMRVIGPEGFGNKNRDWNRPELIEILRERWAYHANSALENAGYNQSIDHRSYSDQGIDKMPQKHLGKSATVMEQRGSTTVQGTYNRKVIELEEIREKRKQAEKDLMMVNYQISTIKGVILNLQTGREKRRQNQNREHIPDTQTIICHTFGDQSEPPDFNGHALKPEEDSLSLPVFEHIKVIDKLTADINKIQQQWSAINQQVHELETSISSTEVVKTYLIQPAAIVSPQMAEYNRRKDQLEHLKEQRKKLWEEKHQLEKFSDDLTKFFPALDIKIYRHEDIFKRIRQPDILHLIRLIEQIKAKKLTRYRHKETIMRRR